MTEIHNKIIAFLDKADVKYKTVHHAVTLTSEDSARERGTPLEWGGKSLVMKIGDEFKIFVISASRRVDTKKIKKYFNEKRRRFITREELEEMTGLKSGSVPPFGQPILPFPLYMDKSVTENEMIAFNAGSLTDSVIMKTEDYLKVAKPEVFDFSEDESSDKLRVP